MRTTGMIWSRAGLAVVMAVVLCTGASAADKDAAKSAAKDSKKSTAESVIDGFVKAIQARKDLDDTKRQAVLALIETQRRSEDSRDATITDALSSLSADFRAAMHALAEEENDKAVVALEKLSKSPDEHLAAEATFYLAKAHMMDEKFEKAVPVLKRARGQFAGKTLHDGEALFLAGSAEARLLHRKEAVKLLLKYVNDYETTAPERLYVGAFRQLEELNGLKKGSLVDVQDRMDFSRRRLALERTADRTRTEQDNIIAMLDKLIEEAEKQEGAT